MGHHPLSGPPPPPPPSSSGVGHGNILYPSAAYGDGFLQMTLGYMSPTTGAYKMDPYFLSQGKCTKMFTICQE